MDFFSPKSGIKVVNISLKQWLNSDTASHPSLKGRERDEGCEESSQQQDFMDLGAPTGGLSPMNVGPGEKQSGEALL